MSKYESIGKKAIENQNLDTNITTINLPSYTRKRYYLGSSGASLEHENSASFDLITCPAGMLKKAFRYSLTDDEVSKKGTIHTKVFDLSIPKPFLMSTTPITQGVWQYVMNYNDSRYQDVALEIKLYNEDMTSTVFELKLEQDLNRPVEQITWYDALLFCNKLSELQGLEPYYKLSKLEFDENKRPERLGPDTPLPVQQASELHIVYAVVAINEGSNGYRLPTELEWDYAFFADHSGRIGGYAGALQDIAWTPYSEVSPKEKYPQSEISKSDKKYTPLYNTTAVKGNRNPNAWGLYDMVGNVCEWVFDYSLKASVTDDNIKRQPLAVLHGALMSRGFARLTQKKLELLESSLRSLKKLQTSPTRKFTRATPSLHRIKGGSFCDELFPTLDVILRGSTMPSHKAIYDIGFRVVRSTNA